MRTRSARANVEARYRAEELIDTPAATLLAIGERELKKAQADFAATRGARRSEAGRRRSRSGATCSTITRSAASWSAAAQKTVDELFAFIREKRLVEPAGGRAGRRRRRAAVRPRPRVDALVAAARSRTRSRATTTSPTRRPTGRPTRQDAWLQKFNYPTLADISAHEVAPGHYVHSLFMRRTPGKIRRIWIGLNPFPQPSSGQDGWAHYAEQLVSDEGFKRDDPRYRLAQISEALTRICRLISGIRLHSGEWTIDQAAEFFEREAHLPAPAARQEAERGTYDPTYGGYFLGKVAAFKLRRDYAAARGSAFNLREFHERVMTNGIAPWWAHRAAAAAGRHAAGDRVGDGGGGGGRHGPGLRRRITTIRRAARRSPARFTDSVVIRMKRPGANASHGSVPSVACAW